MKKILAVLAAFVAISTFSGCGYINRALTNSSNNESINSESNNSVEISVPDNSSTLENRSESSQEEKPPQRETATGKSNKSVDGLITIKATIVRNDKTGNWRYSGFSESGVDISEYALSYYNEYFESDKEIHAVINFANKTTTRISCSGEMLFVAVLKYVEKEEHDANIMFSGEVIKDYIVYTDNGDIEDITEPEIPNSSKSEPVSSVSSVEPPQSPTQSAPESQSNSTTHFNDYDVPTQQQTTNYVLNTSTKKFHRPSCSDVKKINPENYSTISSRSDAISSGYSPCGRCKP